MKARPGRDEALEVALDELRRLLREYQRVKGGEEGGASAAELLREIRAVGLRIDALKRTQR